MCGIAGIVAMRGAPPEEASVRAMLNALAHRGPDDEGIAMLGDVAVGMRRLSVLDTSKRGHQPMRSPDGRLTLVHNGEIYNFLELASELEALGHRFVSGTDTEVMLAAYDAWGIDCVKRFNGIWAFALWDGRRGELHLSRDRLGVKPLFISEQDGRLAFASEIKALLALPWVDRAPDAGVVRDFLIDGLADHTDRTFFAAIQRLPAATTLTIRHGVQRRVRYWQPARLADDASSVPARDDARQIEALRGALIDAVALQLRSDVPLGSCLSGGIDSSGIVAITTGLRSGSLASTAGRQREAQAQLAFFADFDEPGISERRYVDRVVAATGVTLVTTTPGEADVLSTLEAVAAAQDEPFGSTSIVAQHFVMRAAQGAGVKVLLDGQGADELLAGYPPYVAMRHAGALRAGEAASRRRTLRLLASRQVKPIQTLGYAALGERPLPPRLRRNRMPASLLGPETHDATSPVADVPAIPGTVLAVNLWRQIVSENLPSLLRYEDRSSMAFGIEARVPYLDHRLVELALMLPDRLKVAGTLQKAALRRALTGIVPDEVLDRRDKIAFRTPQARWLRAVAPSIAEGPSLAEAAGLIRPGTLTSSVRAFETDRLADDHLWRLLSVELWLRGLQPSDVP
jgi:asparagine synthase (glutamine-hydrolysing)